MSIAFDVVFALFVLLILALAVIAVRWAVGRDRAARQIRRDQTDPEPDRGDPAAPPGDG